MDSQQLCNEVRLAGQVIPVYIKMLGKKKKTRTALAWAGRLSRCRTKTRVRIPTPVSMLIYVTDLAAVETSWVRIPTSCLIAHVNKGKYVFINLD